MNKFTLVVTINDEGDVVITSPDLIKGIASNNLENGLIKIKEVLDKCFFTNYNDKPPIFVQQLYGGLDSYLDELAKFNNGLINKTDRKE